MASEIVEDDDVARSEHRHELLFDIGAEAFAVDRAIEDARSGEPVAAERSKEGQSAPPALRGKAAQPITFLSPSAQRRHVGLDPGLVDEDQMPRIEAALPGSPAPPPSRNIGAGLLKREQRFF